MNAAQRRSDASKRLPPAFVWQAARAAAVNLLEPPMTKTFLGALRAYLVAGMAAVAAAHAGSVSVLVLDKEGKPAVDAVVVLTPASRPTAIAPPPGPFTVSQERMQFVPAVTVVPLGARVAFLNNDGWAHHVRGSAAGAAAFQDDGEGFELRLEGRPDGKPGKAVEVRMHKAGPVLLGCHIHGSMRGFVFVSDSPWAAKTGADGVATVPDVPEGMAALRVWHPDQLIEAKPLSFAVAGGLAKATIKLDVVPRRRRL